MRSNSLSCGTGCMSSAILVAVESRIVALTSLFVKLPGYVDVMDLPLRRRRQAIRDIGRGLGTLDREVFDAIAESPSPLLDATMPRLTRAADHSMLWFALAAAIGASGGPSARRGATRGVLSLAVTSLVTNLVAKRVWRRPRPDSLLVPLPRRGRRLPTSNSLPSGHSASAAAFAVGVGLESPALGLGLA